MIYNTDSLKERIKKLCEGDSKKSQVYFRIFMMERLLERIYNSRYRDRFILKGGLLIASLVGIDMRSTMDIDTTVTGISISMEKATAVIEDILHEDINDNVNFELVKAVEIMEEKEYTGIRFSINGYLDKLRQPISIDISTGDAITPKAIEYGYKLLFENRVLPILSYNLETVLAEKIETVLSRGIANTRMRDFYDLHIIYSEYANDISVNVLKLAFARTCNQRGSRLNKRSAGIVLQEVLMSQFMENIWERYINSVPYVKSLSWKQVVESTIKITELVF